VSAFMRILTAPLPVKAAQQTFSLKPVNDLLNSNADYSLHTGQIKKKNPVA
jgi:hypothetical protein